MDAIARKPVRGPHVWDAGDFQNGEWISPFPEAASKAIRKLVDEVRAAGVRFEDYTPIAALRDGLAELGEDIRDALEDGTGFSLLRGLDISDYSLDELKIVHQEMGRHIGLVTLQTADHPAMISEVTDIGDAGPKEFYYHRGGPLPFHMDPVDVVGLLCIRPALRGGLSGIVSSGALHNLLLAERPDVLDTLYRGFFHLDRHYLTDDGGRVLNDYRSPVYSDIRGDTVCTYLSEPILMTERVGLYTLTPEEREALAVFDETAKRPELILDMDLQPGDFQFLNNRHVLHSRSDYEDYTDREKARMLLRVWMTMPGWTKLPREIPFTDAELGTLPT